MSLSEALTHFGKVDAASMETKGRLNGRLGHCPRLTTSSEYSITVAHHDASASNRDFARNAPPAPADADDTCVSVAIHDNPQRHRSTAPCHIAQLPVEILNEIFVHCLPLPLASDQYLTPRMKDAPMLLCHVCAHWRQVALSLTILWISFSTRCLELHPWFSKTSHNTFELVRYFIDRSKHHPISIEFGYDTLPPVRKLLFANIHRWRDVSIKLSDEIVEELLGIPSGVATRLESLSIQIQYECETTLEEIPAILLLFPNVRRLHFDSLHSHSSLSSNIPWNQLTHIQMRCEMPMDECATFLVLCEHAQHIQISGGDPSGPLEPASAPATLPYLTHLDISFDDDVGTLLDHFTLPSLDFLRICARPQTRRHFQALEDLATRSSCVLKVLHIDDHEMLEEDLIGYLSLPCLRSVEELEIYNLNGIRDRTLSLLVYRDDGIIPRLERLKLRTPITSDGLFSDMIASRWGTSHCRGPLASLQRVSVVFPPARYQQRGEVLKPHDVDILRFAEFTKQGLSIKWE